MPLDLERPPDALRTESDLALDAKVASRFGGAADVVGLEAVKLRGATSARSLRAQPWSAEKNLSKPREITRTDRTPPLEQEPISPVAPRVGGFAGGMANSVANVRDAVGRALAYTLSTARALHGKVIVPISERASAMVPPMPARLRRLQEAWNRFRPRFGFKNLYSRIFIFNLTGLVVMLIGILLLSSQQNWLIEAKRESIQAQAQVIADAIVREATSEDRGFAFPNPDRMLDGDQGQVADQGGYDIQDFEFAIQPEKVAPILQRYSQSSGQRARIYARDGTMIYDSAGLSSRVTRKDLLAPGDGDTETELSMLQHLWMKLDSVFMPSDLPIYREIGRGNGRAYPEVVAALEGVSTPMLMVNHRGSHMVSVAFPIQRMRAVQGVLLLSTRDGDIDGIRRKERHFITWIFVVALVATALTATMLAGTIARPMRKLSEAALNAKRNIKEARDLPTFPEHRDEIGQMALAFRDMTLALYKRIELSEKFAADVAHELKNPVTAVRSAAESLTYVKNEKDREELLENIQTDLKRLNKLITDVSNFSRLDAELSLHEAETIDLGEVTTGVASAFNEMRGTKDHAKPVATELQRTARGQEQMFLISGHEGRLGQVLTNLVDNALSFSPPRGHVLVRVMAADGEIGLTVEDEGPGIPEGRFDKIFERFYTDRPDSEATHGKNSGLGLSITREIVHAHGGTIWAENRMSDDGDQVLGARFVVRLPAMGEGRSGLHQSAQLGRPATGQAPRRQTGQTL
jgi:two-component system, OmpR family, sensor histidine kinase ChvG